MQYARRQHEKGQGLVEYGLLLMLVAVVVVVILAFFGEDVQRTYNCVAITMQNLDGSSPFMGFTLINADTNEEMGPFCGPTLRLTDAANGLNVRADAKRDFGSVRFQLSGPTSHSRTENVYPFALFSDTDGNYYSGSFAPGDYTLTATAYSADGASGDNLGALTISFTVK
jgi:Flp pilus assembly pilin Flp